LTLLLAFITVFVYKDKFWKSTIRVIGRNSLNRIFEKSYFSTITIIAGGLNLLIALSEYLGTDLQEIIGNMTYISLYLIFAFVFYLANFVIQKRYYQNLIESEINSYNGTWIDLNSL